MRSRHSVEEKFEIVMEALTENTAQAEICGRHGISLTQLAKPKVQFIEIGKKSFSEGMHPHTGEDEIDDLKKMIGEQTLVINVFKKKTSRRVGMTVVENLRRDMSLRGISRVSGISLSSFYYKEKERRVKRLSPPIEQDIIRTASERPTYGYRRLWAMLSYEVRNEKG